MQHHTNRSSVIVATPTYLERLGSSILNLYMKQHPGSITTRIEHIVEIHQGVTERIKKY